MNTQNIELVPLSESETSFLKRVYEKRRRIMIRSCITFVPIMMIISIKGAERRPWYDVKYKRKDVAYYMGRKNTYLMNLGVGLTLFSAIAVYINAVRINPLRKDIAAGMKQKIPYTITRKQYFPLTDQYYIWTDKIDNPDHEVDEATYYNCSEGDIIYIYQTPLSKLIFEKDGRHEVI